jgi:hypothetical protein
MWSRRVFLLRGGFAFAGRILPSIGLLLVFDLRGGSPAGALYYRLLLQNTCWVESTWARCGRAAVCVSFSAKSLSRPAALLAVLGAESGAENQ